MGRPRLLIIGCEDGSPRSRSGDFGLAGFDVTASEGGAEGLRMAQALRPDVILIDLTPSGQSGVEVCRELRADDRTRNIPVVLVGAERAPPADAEQYGADEYVGTQVPHAALLSKVQALYRRVEEAKNPPDVTEHLGVRVDRTSHRAYFAGKLLNLTPTEFRLLDTLIRRPGRTFTRKELIDVVIREGGEVTEQAITVYVFTLRKALVSAGGTANLIQSRPRVGYRFREAPESRSELS